jgi:hypothetical protein
VPPDASKTKAKLLDSAARAFARDGVLCAVIDHHALFLARREGELLDVARRQPCA